jgi:hypothetical protein
VAKGADCKSAASWLRRFESCLPHQPSLASRATARQAPANSLQSEASEGCRADARRAKADEQPSSTSRPHAPPARQSWMSVHGPLADLPAGGSKVRFRGQSGPGVGLAECRLATLERSERQHLEGVRKRLERPATMHVIDAGQSSIPVRIMIECDPNAALPIVDRRLAACTPRFVRTAALRHWKVGHQCPPRISSTNIVITMTAWPRAD